MYSSLVFSWTNASAGLLTLLLSAFPPLLSGPPICSRNFPSLVNFSSMSSERLVSDVDVGLLPPIQTLSLSSTNTPCSLSGQSNPWPGPPHARRNFPSASNSSSGGAACARCASGTVRGRCSTQMWSWLSMATPGVCPSTQLLGSLGGHEASTSKTGNRFAADDDCACASRFESVATIATIATPAVRTPKVRHVDRFMDSLKRRAGSLDPAGPRQV